MISVRMTKEWQYDFYDVHGEVTRRTCPKGLALAFEIEVAAAAVAAGCAETINPHSPEFAERVRVHKRFNDILAEVGDVDEATEILLEEEQARAAEAEKVAKAKPVKKGKAEADVEAKEQADIEAAVLAEKEKAEAAAKAAAGKKRAPASA